SAAAACRRAGCRTGCLGEIGRTPPAGDFGLGQTPWIDPSDQANRTLSPNCPAAQAADGTLGITAPCRLGERQRYRTSRSNTLPACGRLPHSERGVPKVKLASPPTVQVRDR